MNASWLYCVYIHSWGLTCFSKLLVCTEFQRDKFQEKLMSKATACKENLIFKTMSISSQTDIWGSTALIIIFFINKQNWNKMLCYYYWSWWTVLHRQDVFAEMILSSLCNRSYKMPNIIKYTPSPVWRV